MSVLKNFWKSVKKLGEVTKIPFLTWHIRLAASLKSVRLSIIWSIIEDAKSVTEKIVHSCRLSCS